MTTDAAFFAWLPALRATFSFFFQLAPAGLAFFAACHIIRHAFTRSPMHLRLIRQIFPWAAALEILRLAVIALSRFALPPAGTRAASGQALAEPLLSGAPALASLILLVLAVRFAARAINGAALCAALGCLANLIFLFLLAGIIRHNPAAGTMAVWPPCAAFILFSPAAGICLAELRILLRRAKDDFGRDYYAFALRACAGPAGLSALGSAAFTAVSATAAQPNPAAPFFLHWGTAAVLLFLIAAVLWLLISRSTTPLRHKASCTLAPALIAAALFCACAAFLPVPDVF